MKVAIRKMGNSQGVLIPKPILAQLGLEGTADLQVRDGVIEIRAVRSNPREGWADDAQRLAEQDGDALVWPVVANEGDEALMAAWTRADRGRLQAADIEAARDVSAHVAQVFEEALPRQRGRLS